MKSKLLFAIIVTIAFCATAYAQDSIFEKLDNLKENLHKYFVDAPKLDFVQKTAIAGILKLHRASVRKDVQQIREIVIKMRQNFRQQLTRDQLLKILEIRDEFAMQRPGVKAALFLKKLEPADRVNLLSLLRQLWRGNKEEIGQNLDNIHNLFKQEVRPILVKELSLTEAQQAELDKIVTEGREKIKPLVVNLINKLFNIRSLVKEVLTDEQRAYIETNREKVFQEILNFVNNL